MPLSETLGVGEEDGQCDADCEPVEEVLTRGVAVGDCDMDAEGIEVSEAEADAEELAELTWETLGVCVLLPETVADSDARGLVLPVRELLARPVDDTDCVDKPLYVTEIVGDREGLSDPVRVAHPDELLLVRGEAVEVWHRDCAADALPEMLAVRLTDAHAVAEVDAEELRDAEASALCVTESVTLTVALGDAVTLTLPLLECEPLEAADEETESDEEPQGMGDIVADKDALGGADALSHTEVQAEKVLLLDLNPETDGALDKLAAGLADVQNDASTVSDPEAERVGDTDSVTVVLPVGLVRADSEPQADNEWLAHCVDVTHKEAEGVRPRLAVCARVVGIADLDALPQIDAAPEGELRLLPLELDDADTTSDKLARPDSELLGVAKRVVASGEGLAELQADAVRDGDRIGVTLGDNVTECDTDEESESCADLDSDPEPEGDSDCVVKLVSELHIEGVRDPEVDGESVPDTDEDKDCDGSGDRVGDADGEKLGDKVPDKLCMLDTDDEPETLGEALEHAVEDTVCEADGDCDGSETVGRDDADTESEAELHAEDLGDWLEDNEALEDGLSVALLPALPLLQCELVAQGVTEVEGVSEAELEEVSDSNLDPLGSPDELEQGVALNDECGVCDAERDAEAALEELADALGVGLADPQGVAVPESEGDELIETSGEKETVDVSEAHSVELDDELGLEDTLCDSLGERVALALPDVVSEKEEDALPLEERRAEALPLAHADALADALAEEDGKLLEEARADALSDALKV